MKKINKMSAEEMELRAQTNKKNTEEEMALRAQVYLTQAECYFLRDEDILVAEECYECLKPLVKAEMYSEVASEIVTSILSREMGKKSVVTVDAVINEVVKNQKIEVRVAEGEKDVESLNTVKKNESYNPTEADRRSAINKIYNALKTAKSEKCEILLDVLDGVDINVIAEKHNKEIDEIAEICDKMMERIKNILVMDEDILVESSEPVSMTAVRK